MRNLGEQWIENGRMYKAVEGIPSLCIGCCWSDAYHCCGVEDCPTNHINKGLIVHDLGPVNEDGLLACPFCGEYPNLENNGYFWYCCTNDDCLAEVGTGKTKQEAIDIWNRRN